MKLRRAYDWIAEWALPSPYNDMELGPSVKLGDLTLCEGPSWSSFLLLPLLTLVTSRRLVFVGAPGRGKTSMAVLMARLAGHPLDEVRQSIQRGHPQLTVADLLGGPLPSELIRAREATEIQVAWRRWIGMRVKIIDEYNRIPTKTQSALLSLMAEGYAEMYESVIHCGTSAWFLTANDELGGGTFPVIEALKDRIDLAVRCMPFHARFLDRLAERGESIQTVPADLIFTPAELDEANLQLQKIPIPNDVLDLVGFFLGQLDFCRRASERLEYQNKDTLHLGGRRVSQVCNEDCPLDKSENLCTQSENGVSARAYQSLLHLVRALAWFRGAPHVTLADVRQLLPWVLHHKLQPNPTSPFFHSSDRAGLLGDRVSWIHQLFDKAVAQYGAYRPLRLSVADLQQRGKSGHNVREEVRLKLEELVTRGELNAPLYESLVTLKALY